VSQTEPRRLIRIKKVQEKTGGTSRVQIWRGVRAATFPPPVQTGPNSIAWFEDEVDNWVANRPRVSYAPAMSASTDQSAPDLSSPAPSLAQNVPKAARRTPTKNLSS
jgi:prophage regulatory protein